MTSGQTGVIYLNQMLNDLALETKWITLKCLITYIYERDYDDGIALTKTHKENTICKLAELIITLYLVD